MRSGGIVVALLVAACGSSPAGELGDAGPDAGPPTATDDAGPTPDHECPGSIPTGGRALGSGLSALEENASTDPPSLALDDQGRPVVAWTEAGGVWVRRWTGSEWTALGGIIEAVPGSTFQTGAVLAARGDQLVVAWAEASGGHVRPFAARWDGSSWVQLGNAIGLGRMFSFRMSLVIDATGAPILAWNENDMVKANVHVSRWSGSSWVPLGGPLSAEPGATSALAPSLALDDDDTLHVAWQEASAIRLRTWTGSEWVPLGGGSFDALPGPTPAFEPHLAADPAGRVLLAFSEANAPTSVWVAAWDGDAWDMLGSDLQSNDGNTNAVAHGLALDPADRAVVVWTEPTLPSGGVYQVHAHRQGPDGFSPLLGGVLEAVPGDGTDALGPSVAIDRCGRIFVAWAESDGTDRHVHVQELFEP